MNKSVIRQHLTAADFNELFDSAKLEGHDLALVREWETESGAAKLCFDRSRSLHLIEGDKSPVPVSLARAARLDADLCGAGHCSTPLCQEWKRQVFAALASAEPEREAVTRIDVREPLDPLLAWLETARKFDPEHMETSVPIELSLCTWTRVAGAMARLGWSAGDVLSEIIENCDELDDWSNGNNLPGQVAEQAEGGAK